MSNVVPDCSEQSAVNRRLWERGDFVATYATRVLRPAEVVVIARHHEALAGRVLEVGCGAGRVLGYLAALGGEVHGIDVSTTMVEYCRRAYPDVDVRLGDLAALGDSAEGPFDAIIAADNILDVFDDAERRCILSEIRKLLAPRGLLIFSSHNLDFIDGEADATGPPVSGRAAVGLLSMVALSSPAHAVNVVARAPRRARNKRRLLPLERRTNDHAILNDSEGDYGALHYYIRRDDQERQLQELGFELLECLDADARPAGKGKAGYGQWLYYVARPVSAAT
jgi:SAM-dependent methyltransferase